MLFILDKQLRVIDTLSNKGEISSITPFFDDEFKQYLITGAETFKFSTLANAKESQHLSVGNSIAFKYKKDYKLFTIVHIEEEHSETFVKTVYAEMAGIELINEIVRPKKILSANAHKFVSTILEDTEWKVGYIDLGLTGVHDFEISDYSNVYSVLQEYVVGKYGGEISLTVQLKGGRVVGKYVNVYDNRGHLNGFRFAYSSNISSITRTVDTSNLATALIGVGKNNITFKEVDAPDKPKNQDFIACQESYERWSRDGKHIMGTFKSDTDSPQELLRLTREELAKRKDPQVKYELKTELLGKDEVSIGDTVMVVDHEFNPPIYLTARVNELTISFTDPNKNECVLSNFREVKTNITDEMRMIASQLEGFVESKFPIGTNDIKDDAITSDKIDDVYTQTITTDILIASKVQAEELIATKADIEDLRVVKAQIGELDAGVVIAEELTSIKGQITTLESDKANIKDLDVIKGKVVHLESEKIDTKEFNASIANMQDAIAKNLYATNAEIDKLKAKDAEINTLITENMTVTNGKIQHLETDVAEVNTAMINKADIKELNVVKGTIESLDAKVAKVDDAVIKNAKITTAEIEKLKVKDGEIETLVSKKVDAEELNVTNANVNQLNTKVADIDKAVIKNAEITNAEIEKLKSKDIEIDNALINKANVSELTAINANIESLKAKDIEIDNALIKKASISDLNVMKATVENMEVKVALIDTLQAKDAEFDNLLAGNLTAKNFKAGAITADSAIIAEEAIGSSQIASLTANKIDSGEIDTAKVKVKSTNGEVEISGYQILVNDTTDLTKKVNRVILGKYKNQDKDEYGLLIRGKDGKTVMMDSEGVHNAGITDGAINNNKIADDANINAKKINIESVVTHINNASTKIEGSSIVMDNKTLNATIKEIENTQTKQGEEFKQVKAEMNASVDKINLTVSKVNTTIGEQNTKIEKTSGMVSVLEDAVNLKVDANGVINAIRVDSSGAKIQGDKIDLIGKVTVADLDPAQNEFGGLFVQEFNKTVVDGGRILTNSIKAKQIDLSNLNIIEKLPDGAETVSLRISENGSIKMKGDLESHDYNEEENTGWKLSKEGDATLNNATVRGSVILPNAGITNFGGAGNSNLLIKSYTTDISNMSHHVGSNCDSTVNVIDEPTAPRQKAIRIVKTNNSGVESASGGRYFIQESLVAGKTYTWSLKIRGKGTLTVLGCEQGGTKQLTLTKDYKEVTHTFVADNRQYHQFVFYSSGNYELEFHSIKLELGSKATGWTLNKSEKEDFVRFWAGDTYENRNNAPFRVMQNGDVYAKNGIYKGTFTGRIEIGNILIEDTKGTKGRITFDSETGAKVLDIEEDEVKIGVNTTIGTDKSNLNLTNAHALFTNKSVDVVKTENGKSHTVVKINPDGKDFMHLNGTHKLVTNGTTMIIEGNQTEFSNNVIVKNSITTNDMIVGNMQMKRRNDSGNKGIDFIFV